jgi:hypothetical protein
VVAGPGPLSPWCSMLRETCNRGCSRRLQALSPAQISTTTAASLRDPVQQPLQQQRAPSEVVSVKKLVRYPMPGWYASASTDSMYVAMPSLIHSSVQSPNVAMFPSHWCACRRKMQVGARFAGQGVYKVCSALPRWTQCDSSTQHVR